MTLYSTPRRVLFTGSEQQLPLKPTALEIHKDHQYGTLWHGL